MFGFVRRSIRHKFSLVVMATTLVALLLAGLALVVYDQRVYRQTGFEDLLAQSEIVGRASAPALAFDDPKAATENLALLSAKPHIAVAAIYTPKGRLFATYTRRNLDLPIPRVPESDGERIEGGNLVMFRRIVENNEIVGFVYMRADYELIKRLVDYAGIFGAVMVLSLLVTLFISGRLQSALIQPLLDVASVTREIMRTRDFSIRAQKTTEDEIGELVDSLNAMLAEIARRAEALEESNRSLAHEAAERRHADDALRQLNVELEQRIADRTTQLEAANKELEGFSYSVSHDLRAPLRAVVGFSQMVMEDHAATIDAEGKRKLEVVQAEARRMGVLIDELLAFSRLGRKAMQVVDVNMTELARATYEGLSAQHQGTKPEFRLGTLPASKGDRVLLGQVWANLISNAMKFSSKRDKPLIEVSSITDDKEHVYFVRDNGAGFDPRYQSKLFGVFQRLHNAAEFPGTGVGLALVQRIVVRHGGRVWADSRPGEGATFYFTLPREQSDERI